MDFIFGLVLAIAVGALVGLEREYWRRYIRSKYKYGPIFGARTAILFSILGYLLAYTYVLVEDTTILSLGFILSFVFVTTVYFANAMVHRRTGATTSIAMLIVFVSGMLVGLNNYVYALSLSVITAFLLFVKRNVDRFVFHLKREEIMSAIKFAIIAVVILPLLPNRTIDPWGVFNPYSFWYIVVAVSGISFLSYIMLKVLKQVGILLTGFLGGLINSAATTFSLASMSTKRLRKYVESGILMSLVGTVFADPIIIFLVGSYNTLKYVVPFQLVGMATALFIALCRYDKGKTSVDIKLDSPFAILPALKFALIMTALLFVSAIVKQHFGDISLLPIAAIVSIYSSSAVIVSSAIMAKEGAVTPLTASSIILVAEVMSALTKTFWSKWSNDKRLVRFVFVSMLIVSVAMVLTYTLILSSGFL